MKLVNSLIHLLSEASFKRPFLERLRLRVTMHLERRNIAKENRSKVSFMETPSTLLNGRQTLSRRIPNDHQMYTGNLYYGIGRLLMQHAGLQGPVTGYIEHGLYVGNYVNPREVHGRTLWKLITMSAYRKHIVREHSQIPVVTVGPYIAYADLPVNDSEFRKLKQQLGRVLLVFPSHSDDSVRTTFDQLKLISDINNLAKEFDIDTILVSLYFRDLEAGSDKPYTEAGMTVVTAGHRNDHQFLNRLKLFIELSDITASNAFGTHIGYCVYLGKPHTYMPQHIHRDGVDDVVEGAIERLSDPSAQIIQSTFETMFTVPTSEITQDQYNFVSNLWGFNEVRSSDSLRELLTE